MSSFGRVVGGAFLNSSVTTATFGSDLVVQTGFKGRKLTAENVRSWADIPVESNGGAISAVGKAAAGAVLPGRFGKAASAAVGAALDSKKPPHTVRVDWVDGTQSLIKLPDALFTHFALVLAELRVAGPEPAPAAVESAPAQPTVTEQAFSLVSDLVKDRFPARNASSPIAIEQPPAQAVPVDVAEQLMKLASLRDAGILTDEEFLAKKSELLARL